MHHLVPQWFRKHVGHRGTFLLFLAFVNYAYGYTLLTDPAEALRHYDTWLPLTAWGWLWIAAGVMHTWFAFRDYDTPSFTIAALIKSAWAAMFVDLTVLQHYHRGWLLTTFWILLAAQVLHIASWPESPDWDNGGPE